LAGGTLDSVGAAPVVRGETVYEEIRAVLDMLPRSLIALPKPRRWLPPSKPPSKSGTWQGILHTERSTSALRSFIGFSVCPRVLNDHQTRILVSLNMSNMVECTTRRFNPKPMVDRSNMPDIFHALFHTLATKPKTYYLVRRKHGESHTR
jgi:hypothetical protein